MTRVVAGREGEMDTMTVRIEATGGSPDSYQSSVMDVLKLKAKIEVVEPGALPRDGLVIEDQRSYD